MKLPGIVVIGFVFASSIYAQGQCRDGYRTPKCPLSVEVATAPAPPVFAATGWRTVALDHITFLMQDYRKEAAFYIGILGWKLRSDDGSQAVLDTGNGGSAVFRHSAERRPARVTGLAFVIEPWNARVVEAELRKRGLAPVAENNGRFESFHVKDPDGFDLQICNGDRSNPSSAKLQGVPLVAPTGWHTVWFDHFSYRSANYKVTVSFYTRLLGWTATYDEGSQEELLIGDVGNMIVRGPNPNNPHRVKLRPLNSRIDHISYGISPWDTDAVKAALEKRGLRVRADTSTGDDIHVAAFKSYHTTTPNGYDLQLSDLTHDTRLVLLNAVKPKALRQVREKTRM